MVEKIRAIAIVERNDNEILLVKRDVDPLVVGYVLMGTKVEFGKNPEKTLMKKYKENTGIEIIIEDLIVEKLAKNRRTMWYKARPSNVEQKPIAKDLVDARYVPKSGIFRYITDMSSLKGMPLKVADELGIRGYLDIQ